MIEKTKSSYIKEICIMDRKELEEKVIEMVAMAYGKNAAELSVDSSFKDDLKG